jgi:glycine/D-amino acid oxidase-like deaminating enzyme
MASSAKHTHSRLPNATSTKPYWRSQLHDLDEFRSSETVPEIVDVAIIGGGLAGACTAYHLLSGAKNEGSHIEQSNIAIFEARQACSGATGRNGGHTKLAPVMISKFATQYGAGAAVNFALFLRELMHKLKACAESIIVSDTDEGTPGDGSSSRTLAQECELLITRSWDVFLDENHAADVEKEWNQAVSGIRELARKDNRERDVEWLGDIQFLKGPIAEQVSCKIYKRLLNSAETRQVTSIRGAKAALACPAMTLWPYKFVLGLLSHVVQLGVKLYTLTPVMRIERVSEKESDMALSTIGLTRLHTPRGITLARKVVFSSNAYVSALLEQYENTIIPGRGTACHIVRTPSASSNSGDSARIPSVPDYTRLVNTYNINGGPSSREYLVPQPDGSIVLGGGQPLYRADKDIWYDMIDDGTLIPGVQERWFEGYMGRHFHGWDKEGTEEKIDHIWTGSKC